MTGTFIRSIRAAAVGLAAFSALQATAEDSAQTPSESAAAGQIEEVMVTAQRREESIQSVPVAVTAVSGERLDALGAVTIHGMRGYIPNV